MKEKDRISEVEDQDRLKSLLKSAFNTHEGHPGLGAALWVRTLADGAESKSMHDRETAAELVGLISELLQQHGHNIEGKDEPICCLASNEFVVAMYLVEPSHAFYEILQHDDGENMLKVFTAVRHSNTIDLRLYREGPWQKSFRSFVDETIDPGRARNLNRRTDLGLMKLH